MTMTVGDLIRQLKNYDEKTEVSFSGLDFYRFKRRSDTCVQLEFNQLVYKDRNTGQVIIENLD